MVPALPFLARHFLLVVLAMLAGCVLWTILYLVLLLLGILLNQGLGGPMTFPVGILAIIAACVVFGWGVFAPATGVGAIFCRLMKLPKIAAIPVVWVSALVFTYFVYWGWIELMTTHSLPPVAVILKTYTLLLSIPLGIYWWLTEGPGAFFDMFRMRLRRVRGEDQLVADNPPIRSGMLE